MIFNLINLFFWKGKHSFIFISCDVFPETYLLNLITYLLLTSYYKTNLFPRNGFVRELIFQIYRTNILQRHQWYCWRLLGLTIIAGPCGGSSNKPNNSISFVLHYEYGHITVMRTKLNYLHILHENEAKPFLMFSAV